MTVHPLHLVPTTGAANPLGDASGNRRFYARRFAAPAPLLEFRIKAPGCKAYDGLFANAQQARQHAERTFPGTFPASVTCISRQHPRSTQ